MFLPVGANDEEPLQKFGNEDNQVPRDFSFHLRRGWGLSVGWSEGSVCETMQKVSNDEPETTPISLPPLLSPSLLPSRCSVRIWKEDCTMKMERNFTTRTDTYRRDRVVPSAG